MVNDEELKNLHGEEYAKRFETFSPSRLVRLKKYLKLNSDFIVADFACGNGMLFNVIGDDVKEYHGVDFSRAMLDSAKKRLCKPFVKAYFYEDDINVFCEQHVNEFDVGFALDFSEHVYDAEWIKILTSIKRSLKDEGVLYLHTPNKDYFIEFLKDVGVLRQFPEHIAVRTFEQNKALLISAGFDKVSVRYLSHYEWWQKPFWLFSYIPLIGQVFKARLFISAKK